MIGDLMLKILICDDNNMFVKKLEHIVSKFFMQNEFPYSIECIQNQQEINELDPEKYNVFLLDVELGRENGIDLGKKIREVNPDATIVYISSYVSYSPAGYKVKAFDYILKDDPNFESSIFSCLNNVLIDIFAANETISFKIDRETTSFSLNHIVYFEGDKRRVIIHTKDNYTYTTYAKLSDIAEELSDKAFLRIQKSFIVNLKYVKRIVGYNVYMAGGEILKTSTDPQTYSNILKTFIRLRGEI